MLISQPYRGFKDAAKSTVFQECSDFRHIIRPHSANLVPQQPRNITARVNESAFNHNVPRFEFPDVAFQGADEKIAKREVIHFVPTDYNSVGVNGFRRL